MDSVRQFVARRNEQNLPVTFIAVTNHVDMERLKFQMELPHDRARGVLYGGSPRNLAQIYQLNGLFAPNGTRSALTINNLASLQAAQFAQNGFIPKTPFTDPTVQTAWYHLSHMNFSVLNDLRSVTRQRNETGEQATALVNATMEWLGEQARQAAELTPSIDGLAQLERVATWTNGIRDLNSEHRTLTGMMRDWGRDQAVRNEIAVRQAYYTVRGLEAKAEGDTKKFEEVMAAYNQVAERGTGSTYGTLASQAAQQLANVLAARRR